MEVTVEETRHRIRYVVRGMLRGFIGQVEMTVCDLSETGVQLEHAAPLRVGTRARGAVQHQGRTVPFVGIVTRSRLSTTAGAAGKLLYRTGVRFEDPDTNLLDLIQQLVRDGMLSEDPGSLERKRKKLAARNVPQDRGAMRVLRPVVAVPQDKLLLVRQARERLRANPDEARKWYNRVRFVEPERAAALARSPFRDEILAVWEYLERSIELTIVAAAFDSPVS